METLPQLLSQAYATARVPTAEYEAILIDEGQDFADDWYRLLLRALDPETNRLFIALDSSQNIYKRRVAWRAIGIQIVGHTRVLTRNYRNTVPILSAAYRMIQELDVAQADPGELTSALVVPDQALRSGPAPEVTCCESVEGVRRHARDWIMARIQRGVAPSDILIIGYSRPGMKETAAWLCREGITASFLPDRRADGTVSVSTIHADGVTPNDPPARFPFIVSFSVEGVRTFNGDGTGTVTARVVSIGHPTALPASTFNPTPIFIRRGANSSDIQAAFTYQVAPDRTVAVDNATLTGTTLTGPNAGQTFTITNFPLFSGYLSKDRRTLTLAHLDPAVETHTFSNNTSDERICHRSMILLQLKDGD